MVPLGTVRGGGVAGVWRVVTVVSDGTIGMSCD